MNVILTIPIDFCFFEPKRSKTLSRFFDNSRGFDSSTVILRLMVLDILLDEQQCNHICGIECRKYAKNVVCALI